MVFSGKCDLLLRRSWGRMGTVESADDTTSPFTEKQEISAGKPGSWGQRAFRFLAIHLVLGGIAFLGQPKNFESQQTGAK